MYGNTSAAGSVMATGLIAANSGWAICGWCLLGVSAVAVGAMTVSRLLK